MSSEVAPQAPRGGWRRWLVVGGLAGAALAAASAVILWSPDASSPRHSPSDGGFAVSAVAVPGPAGAAGVQLAGSVVDGAGHPVAGAEVSVEPEPDDQLTTSAPADAGTFVAIAPATKTDGLFAIAGLTPGRYRLRVRGAGLLAAEVRYVAVPADAAQIVVARQVTIEGKVSDGGKPAANVIVALRGEAIGGAIETRTDPSGGFRFAPLPEGRYQLLGWRGGLAARTVRVNRLGSGPFGAVELQLEVAAIVVGRVIDRDEGTPLEAAVELRPTGDDQAPRYARSGPDGVFRIEGVPNGRWIADAFAPGYLTPGGIELEAGRGVPELAMVRGGAVEGRVVDGSGRPIRGAAVRALGGTPNAVVELSEAVDSDKLRRFSGVIAAPAPVALSPGSDPQLVARGELGVMVGPIPPIPLAGALPARPAQPIAIANQVPEPPPLPRADRDSIWTTDTDGRFRIRGLAKGKHTIVANVAGFAEARSKQLAVEPGQLIPGVDLVVTAGTMLTGRITDQHGVPVAGAHVAARPELGAQLETISDTSGDYVLGPVTGTVELRVDAHGHADSSRTIELAAARGPTAAEHRENFVIAVADAMLMGTLDDDTGAPVGGAQLEIASGASAGRTAVVAADGTFTIEMLPAGPVRVRVRHPGYPVAELDANAVRGGQPSARLRLALGGGVDGAVLDASTGTPLSGVTITGAGPTGQAAEVTSDGAGRWRLVALALGHWRLSIKQPGYLALVRDVEVSLSRVPGGSSLHDVRLELTRGALIGGTVHDARGQRVAGARIVIRRSDGDGIELEAKTDTAGEFRLRDCPTGDVIMTASVGERRGELRVTARPGGEHLGLSIDVK
ncbi:MAG: carboxypeptidase regulatory-like domain-containing protein [Kofleriaceae bacterium]